MEKHQEQNFRTIESEFKLFSIVLKRSQKNERFGDVFSLLLGKRSQSENKELTSCCNESSILFRLQVWFGLKGNLKII